MSYIPRDALHRVPEMCVYGRGTMPVIASALRLLLVFLTGMMGEYRLELIAEPAQKPAAVFFQPRAWGPVSHRSLVASPMATVKCNLTFELPGLAISRRGGGRHACQQSHSGY